MFQPMGEFLAARRLLKVREHLSCSSCRSTQIFTSYIASGDPPGQKVWLWCVPPPPVPPISWSQSAHPFPFAISSLSLLIQPHWTYLLWQTSIALPALVGRVQLSCWYIWALCCGKVLHNTFGTPCTSRTCIIPAQVLIRTGP